MVHNLILQTRLHWEWFIEEFLIEVLLLFLHENTGYTCFIELRTTSSSYHLKEICERKVDIATNFRIEELSTLYYNQSSWEVNSPS